MKRLRILTLILLILSVGAFFATNALRRLRADSTLPQISCGDDVLYLSVEDGRDAMLLLSSPSTEQCGTKGG